MLAMMLSTVTLLSSCGGDDEDDIVAPEKENEKQSVFVGKWKYSFEDADGGYALLTFKEDGTGTYFEWDNGEVEEDNRPFYYSYEEIGAILTLTWIKNGQTSHKQSVRLTWLNNKTFTADILDQGDIWVKQ